MNISLRGACAAAVVVAVVSTVTIAAQEPTADIVFRSGVDVVSVTAVVRDRHNRVVSSLTREELQVFDAGEARPIVELRSETSSPASVALLVDGSGSMRIGAALSSSRRIVDAVLSSLDTSRDQASLMTFDSRLIMLQSFTSDFARVRSSLNDLEAWGSTSLYDAVAGAAGIVSARTSNRRAVVVLTDGADNNSAYTPERVSAIASSIDVPIYVMALGPQTTGDNTKALADLARETGGDLIVANTPKLVDQGIARLVEELRHQYLISFQASAFDGLRRIEVRTRRGDLKVRSRAWYFAGASE